MLNIPIPHTKKKRPRRGGKRKSSEAVLRADVIDRGVFQKVTLHRLARSVGRLKHQHESGFFLKGVSPQMREDGFKDEDIPLLHKVYLAVNDVFDFPLQALNELMPGMHDLTLSAAASVRFERDEKRFELLLRQGLANAFDDDALADNLGARSGFDVKDRRGRFLLEKIRHADVKRRSQALQSRHAGGSFVALDQADGVGG